MSSPTDALEGAKSGATTDSWQSGSGPGEAGSMGRSMVSLRCADLDDAHFLADLWSESLRRADPQEQVAEVELIVKAAVVSSEQRIVIAEYDGEPAGAVFLTITTMGPLNLEPLVQAVSPHVLPAFRRHGIGRMLMEAAVSWAEEHGIAHVMTAATSGSRDANRYMARLGFASHVTVRIAPTHVVRSKIEAQRPAAERIAGRRQLGQLLAARRSMRRHDVSVESRDLPAPE
ncbi:GNAT family N-acetyltransferase [Nocardioides fonticola]